MHYGKQSGAALRALLWGVVLIAANAAAAPTAITLAGGEATVSSASESSISFAVTRTGDLSYDAVFNYYTIDGSAVAGTDYLARSGHLLIPAGQTASTIQVPVLGQATAQPDKQFLLDVSRPAGITASPVPPLSFEQVTQKTPAASSYADQIIAADFNGDGRPDLVQMNSSASG